MQINILELENYRNFTSLRLDFADSVNIICGENGRGKTNILESIYLCGTGKSHKGSREKEIILHDREEAHVKGEFSSPRGNRRIDIHLKKDGVKGIAVDRIPIKKLSELYGKVPVVIFSAEDMDIIKRGPAVRRRFMDIELCQTDPVYVENLISYNHILVQRRELLKEYEEKKQSPEEFEQLLDILDLQLSAAGEPLIKRRKRFTDEINPEIGKIHERLSGGRERVRLVYMPSAGEDELYERLLKTRERDIFLKQTSVGPHRDDFSFFDRKKELKIYGSNGQQRTAAVALKLAQINLIEKTKREKPVLLLDDVLSELDRGRQKMLLESLGGMQTIITCTGMDEFLEQELGKVKQFIITENGCEIR